MKCLLCLLSFVTLATTCIADSVSYVRVHRPLLAEHLKLAPEGEADRVRAVRNLFQQAGCPQLLEQAVPEQRSPNVICILPGDAEGTIVVGASSDYAPEKTDAPVHWGALVMLPLLVESLMPVPHRLTLMLIAFTGHEQGMRGATWYVSQLTEVQRKTIRAMVDLDNLGKAPAVYALDQPDNTLATWLHVAANSVRVSDPGQLKATGTSSSLKNGVGAAKDGDRWTDDQAFEQAHIAAITLQSATPATLSPPRQDGATPDRLTGAGFDMDAYEDTYRLVCVYVLYLDRNLGRPLVEPGVYSGKIIDTAGVFPTSPIEVSVKIDRFSTPGELNRYESVLRQSGQEGLAEALANENDKGSYRFGLSLAFSVKLVALQDSGKGLYVFLVATRPKRMAGTARDYRFTVIKLHVDSKGVGDGAFYNTAAVGFNKKHEFEIGDFGSQPDEMRNVRLEQPAAPRTTVATTGSATGAAPAAPGQIPAVSVRPPGLASANERQDREAAKPPATTAEATTTPTFHAKAQLVQVDVVVTDQEGRPVPGLQQADFTVLEDGKAQEIRAFEIHLPPAKQAGAAQEPQAQVELPPHTYTNRVVSLVEDTVSILLLDLLNTPVSDQAYARKQTLEFLKTLPSGKRIAMFVLANKLVMVQGFTGDCGTLVAATEKVMNDRPLVLTTESERQQFQGNTEAVGRIASPGVNAPGAPVGTLSNVPSGGDIDFGSAQHRERSNAFMEADRTSQRVSMTLTALSGLARAVSGYPGRKNLVWLSGSFPIRLKPGGIDLYRMNSVNPSSGTGLASTPDFLAEVRNTTTALATARVAVYPIDVRGLQTAGIDIVVGAAESASFSGTDNPLAYTQNLNSQSETRFSERSSMKEVAQQTGGEVLPGNDVRGAISRAIEGGSTYYTVAYTPAKDDANPQFRNIEIKLNRGGLKLAYRPGYYPNANHDATRPKAHPLIVAMQPGLPPSTGIALTVEVVPPDDINRKVRLHYSIDIRDINFADTAEHRKRAVLDCVAVAFTLQGTPAGQVSNTWDATLPIADYESALRSGLSMSQELDLPPGRYSLQLGVMDRGSQRIGTLEVPLAEVAKEVKK
jgi:VWFA-related protein